MYHELFRPTVHQLYTAMLPGYANAMRKPCRSTAVISWGKKVVGKINNHGLQILAGEHGELLEAVVEIQPKST